MKNLLQLTRSMVLLLSSSILLFACSSDDESTIPEIDGPYGKGVFVVNEGNFGTDNSEIGFYYPEKDSVVNSIFFKANGRKLGNTTQSMFIDDTLSYIVVNASNKLEVVNTHTFKSRGGIEVGLANPRYFTNLNDKGFITNWGSFDLNFVQVEAPFIAVIDLNTLEIEEKVALQDWPENIITIGNKVIFTIAFGNSIGILDPVSLETEIITLGTSVSSMVEDEDGKLWVIVKGDSGENNGKLLQIDPSTASVESTIALGAHPGGGLVTNSEKNKLYYTVGKSVFEYSINSTAPSSNPVLTNESVTGFYGLGYDPVLDEFYIGDANGFQGSGTVYRYSLDGILLDSFETGVGPNGFVFQ